jgi:hypothetical protein
MMGTHVRVNIDHGSEAVVPTPIRLVAHLDRAVSGYSVLYPSTTGDELSLPVTKAEYTRLAALLTGEGARGQCERCGVRVDDLSRRLCVGCLDKPPRCSSCHSEGWVTTPTYAGCAKHMPKPPDPRTPGQVLHAAYCLEFMSSHVAWSDTGEHTRATWERVAAVLAHGRGNK